jgi:uncharacterized membrane protein YfcA
MEILDFIVPLVIGGIISGFFGGLLGLGGGVVAVPILFAIYEKLGIPFEWRMHVVVGTSLAGTVAVNITSVMTHHKKGAVDWAIVKDWVMVTIVGALIGAFFAKGLKTTELVYFFATLLLLLAFKMLLPMDKFHLGTALPSGVMRFLPPGVIAFFSAVMGIGGGSFTVPYMSLYSVAIHRAVGTAAAIGLFISAAGALGFIVAGMDVSIEQGPMLGFVHVPTLFTLGLAAMLVAPLGAKTAHRLPKPVLRGVFGVFLIVAATRMLMAA